jgi:1,2-phenylacetyl-CoA epoxidase catalytic subunit
MSNQYFAPVSLHICNLAAMVRNLQNSINRAWPITVHFFRRAAKEDHVYTNGEQLRANEAFTAGQSHCIIC